MMRRIATVCVVLASVAISSAAEARRRPSGGFAVDLLYSDQVGAQPTISRFAITPAGEDRAWSDDGEPEGVVAAPTESQLRFARWERPRSGGGRGVREAPE